MKTSSSSPLPKEPPPRPSNEDGESSLPDPRRIFSFSVSAARVLMTRSALVLNVGQAYGEVLDSGAEDVRREGLANMVWRDQKVV